METQSACEQSPGLQPANDQECRTIKGNTYCTGKKKHTLHLPVRRESKYISFPSQAFCFQSVALTEFKHWDSQFITKVDSCVSETFCVWCFFFSPKSFMFGSTCFFTHSPLSFLRGREPIYSVFLSHYSMQITPFRFRHGYYKVLFTQGELASQLLLSFYFYKLLVISF